MCVCFMKRKWLSIERRSFITWLYSTMHEGIISTQTKVSSSTIDLSVTHLGWPSARKLSFTGVLISFSSFSLPHAKLDQVYENGFLFFLSDSPTRANFVSLDINSAVIVTVCVVTISSITYFIHSPVMTDLHSLRLFIQHWTVATTFSSGRIGRRRRKKKDIEHFLFLSLSSAICI